MFLSSRPVQSLERLIPTRNWRSLERVHMPLYTRGRASMSLCVCVYLLYMFLYLINVVNVDFNLNSFLCDLFTNISMNMLTVPSVSYCILCVCVCLCVQGKWEACGS